MHFKKTLKTFLFPAASILLAVFILRSFFIADLDIIRTFPVARINAMRPLTPESLNYLWEVNMHHLPVNKSHIRFYADFYEHLLEAYPCLRDIDGILGYCYHYLGDDAKAIDYFKKAILYNPRYTWNYYDLAIIYISESRYQEALSLLLKLRSLDPQQSLQRMLGSQYVYGPVVMPGGKESVSEAAEHLKRSYKVSIDLIQLINQIPYDQQAAMAIKRMRLEVYAF